MQPRSPRPSRSLLRLLLLGVLALAPASALAQAVSPRDRAEARKQIRLLGSKDSAQLKAAAQALLAMGDRASNELARALGDPSTQVRTYASAVLVKIGEPAVDDLLPLLGEQDKLHQSAVLHTLAKLPAAIPHLIARLGERDDAVRNGAVHALILTGDPAVAALTEAAGGADARVREGAVYALEKLGKPVPAGPKAPAPAPSATPRPAQPQPTQPQPAQSEAKVPRTPLAPRRSPPLRGVRGERSEVDDARQELTQGFVAEIEALAAAGKREQAKLLLWGVWAQIRRERYWAARRGRGSREGAQALKTLYQRAHDACYGSGPALGSMDGEEELRDALVAAQGCLKMGDAGTAVEVVEHARARVEAGLRPSPELVAGVNAVVAACRELDASSVAALNKALSKVSREARERAGLNLEERIHALFLIRIEVARVRGSSLAIDRQGQAVLNKAENLAKGILADLGHARDLIAEFSAAAGDPLHLDQTVLRASAQHPEVLLSYALLTANARAAVYGPRQLETSGVILEVAQVRLDFADVSLASAATAYQRDKAKDAQAHLANAASALESAAALGVAPEAIAARKERAEGIKASAGAGKLRRALNLVEAAEKALARANRSGAQEAGERLAAAKDWLSSARKEGITPTEVDAVEARLGAAALKLPSLYADLMAALLGEAEEHLAKARPLISAGERAWEARSPLERALKLQAQALELRARVAPSAGPALDQRAAGLARDAAALETQIVAAQRLPADAFKGSDGASWRRAFQRLVRDEREWEVLGVSLADASWKETSASYEYAGGGNTKIVETRWYRHLFAWVALADPDDPSRVQLRYLGFRLHKFTDGSYRQLKLYWVEEPVPMLRKNLPE